MPARKPKRARGKSAKSKKGGSRRPRQKASRKKAGRKQATRRAPRRRATPTRKAVQVAPPAASQRVPSGIGLTTHHLDYTSHDMDGIKHFYTVTLGFTKAQHDPANNYLIVQTGPSSSLGFMPPMPGPPEQ